MVPVDLDRGPFHYEVVLESTLPAKLQVGDSLAHAMARLAESSFTLREADDLNARFPAERFARVTFRLTDGRVLKSDTTPARGDAERPLSDEEIRQKYVTVASPTLGDRTPAIARAIDDLAGHADVRELLGLLLEDVAKRGLVALDEALHRLAARKPQHSRIVELRFFGGLTIAETAQVMGLSHATVERDWSLARAWLYQELAKK